jgi:hypothetical protein
VIWFHAALVFANRELKVIIDFYLQPSIVSAIIEWSTSVLAFADLVLGHVAVVSLRPLFELEKFV